MPSTGLVFQPPLEPELIEPAAGAAIGDPTVFRWSPPEPGGSSTLSFWCEWMDAVRGHSFVGYAVEAEGIEATLPAIPDVSVPPGAACTWFVFWCAATDPSVEQRCSWSAERSVSF